MNVHDLISYQVVIESSFSICSSIHQIPVALYNQFGHDKPLDFNTQGSKQFSVVASSKFTVV